MSFSLGADEFMLEAKTRPISFSAPCHGCAPVCSQTFAVNLPAAAAALNEGAEAASVRSPVQGGVPATLLHHKEHLQMRRTQAAPTKVSVRLHFHAALD